MVIFISLVLLFSATSSLQKCSVTYQITGWSWIPPEGEGPIYSFSFLCTNTDPENFVYDFFHTNQTIYDNGTYNLKITNSRFVNLYSFYLPFPSNYPPLKELSLTKSHLEFIEDGAFEDLIYMNQLALSDNNLKNMFFVKTLPVSVERLYLDGNNFEMISDVFGHLSRLSVLDLSNCKIINIEPNSFSKVSNFVGGIYNRRIDHGKFDHKIFINISHNKLQSFEEIFERESDLTLDLSFNDIEFFDQNQELITFQTLDLSYNKIKNINNLKKVRVFDLKLAGSSIDFGFEYCPVERTLDLSSNELPTLTANMFKMCNAISVLNLSNSSITKVEPNAFNNLYRLSTLNISFNPISELKNSIFFQSRISTLDFSNCLIEKIQSRAFFGLNLTESLDLSHNRLTFIPKNAFEALTEVEKIDLSFNPLKKIDNDLFLHCQRLKVLDLSSAKIEVVRSKALAGTSSLHSLFLQNNLLTAIDFQSFSKLNYINLGNNTIRQLDFSFLRNLTSVEFVLSRNKIGKLKNNSVGITSPLQSLDLDESEIHTVESNAFRGLFRLEILSLRDNLLENIEPETFLPLNRLTTLDLTGNKLKKFSTTSFVFGNHLRDLAVTFFNTGLPANTFVSLNNLESLTISDSRISSLSENCFWGLIKLKQLIFTKSEVWELSPGAFRGVENLQNFDKQTVFVNLTTVETGTFEGLQRLVNLNLSNLGILSLKREAFRGLLALQKLTLDNNRLTVIKNNTFLGLDVLQILNLSKNSISSLDIDAFAGLSNLRKLHLSGNKLANLTLGTFQQFPTLQVLNLRRNKINRLLTGTFSNLKSLSKLDLAYNNITKLKMESLITLTNLEHLDLTGNHLIQIVHTDLIKSLRQLKFVGLNDNKWKCDNLVEMLIDFQNYTVDWMSSQSMTFTHENIDGIKCFDICNFFYCVDEQEMWWGPK